MFINIKTNISLLVIALFLITITSAQLGYNNPNLPRINPPAKVTAVSANYNETYNNLLNQQCPTGKVVNGTLSNGTFTCTTDQTSAGSAGNPFNQDLNTTSNVTFDYLTATGNITSNKWFNGLFNWLIGATSTRWLSFNGSTLNFNQTTLANDFYNKSEVNNTIADYGVRVGFNSTFNETYKNLLGQTCPSGQVVNGTLSNGTLKCQTVTTTAGDFFFTNFTTSFNNNLSRANNTLSVNKSNCWLNDCGGFRNPFNQNLNTTSNPKFNGVILDQSALGNWMDFIVLGDVLNFKIGRFTSINNQFQLEPYGAYPLILGNISKGYMAVQTNGYIDFTTLGGFRGMDNYSVTFESNNSRTTINTTTIITRNLTLNQDLHVLGNITVGNIITTKYLNATNDICVTGGTNKCLNKSVTISEPTQDNIIGYFDLDTRTWQPISSPSDSTQLTYCDNGGLQWLPFEGGCAI